MDTKIVTRSCLKFVLILILYFTPIYAITDGPYVFFRETDIEVITIIDGNMRVERFDKGSEVILTVPAGDSYPSFDVYLRNEHTITDSHIKELSGPLLVIADFHGRFDAFVSLLRHLDIIDESMGWNFKEGHVIQLGDMLSRGDQQTELLWLTYKLEKEAEDAGGGFHTILGNHETMHLAGDLRYVNNKYFVSANIMGLEYNELFGKNSLFGRWLRNKNVIMKMGDYLFVHGGYSPQLMESGLGIDEINDIVRDDLRGFIHANTPLITGPYGPLWYRGYFRSGSSRAPYDKLTQADIDSIVDYLGIERIFVGHTRFDELQFKYNGRVIGVDIEHASNKIEAFLYKNGKGLRIGTDGSVQILYTDEYSAEFGEACN